MRDEKLPEWLIRPPEPVVVAERRGPLPPGAKLVIIGTSGSPDYLQDSSDKRFWPLTASDYALACDGLHDEGAPARYLCSACFPDRGDLAEPQDAEPRPDEPEEME